MIRGKRNDAYGRQTLRVDCCGWESYREAVSYIIRRICINVNFEILSRELFDPHPLKQGVGLCLDLFVLAL